MEFAKARRSRSRQRLEELHCGGHDNRAGPGRGQRAQSGGLKLDCMVMGGDNLFRIFVSQHERLPINIHRLIDNVCERKHYENMPELQRDSRLQQISHHGRCFAASHRSITGPDRDLW